MGSIHTCPPVMPYICVGRDLQHWSLVVAPNPHSFDVHPRALMLQLVPWFLLMHETAVSSQSRPCCSTPLQCMDPHPGAQDMPYRLKVSTRLQVLCEPRFDGCDRPKIEYICRLRPHEGTQVAPEACHQAAASVGEALGECAEQARGAVSGAAGGCQRPRFLHCPPPRPLLPLVRNL